MGTPDFAVPTLLELAGRGHDIAAVYTRAAKPGGAAGWSLQPIAGRARGAAARPCRCCTPASLKDDAAQAAFARAQGRCRGRGRLRADPAEADPRCAAARLLQPACLAAAALARRRADQPRDHGGRRRDRRHRDEDGRGARHRRRSAMARARADRRRHDGGRAARRAGAARRRSDGARARRRWSAARCNSRRSRPTASPTRRRSTRPKRGSTGRKPWQAGARPHPRAVAVSRRLVRDSAASRASRCCARRKGEGSGRARHGARRPPHHRLRRRRGAPRRSCSAPAGSR